LPELKARIPPDTGLAEGLVASIFAITPLPGLRITAHTDEMKYVGGIVVAGGDHTRGLVDLLVVDVAPTGSQGPRARSGPDTGE